MNVCLPDNSKHLSERASSLFLMALTLASTYTHIYTEQGWRESFLNLFLLIVNKNTSLLLGWSDVFILGGKKKACWFYQRLNLPGHLHVATSLTFLTAIASLLDQVINLNWSLLMARKVTWVTCRYTLIWWLPSGFLVMLTTQLWFLSCNPFSSINQAFKPPQTAKAISL